jgi:hypothetical protein
MSISTYFKPNIHQNGPEVLGVKVVVLIPVNLTPKGLNVLGVTKLVLGSVT